MTAHDREPDPDAAAEIVLLVQRCQDHWGMWASVDDEPQRQIMRDAHKLYLEQLWVALEPYLRRVAYNWLRSNLAPDVDSLTQSMFSYVIEALPRLRLNPEKNPISYLMTIAWRGCYDEYGRYYDVRRVRRRPSDQLDEEGDEEAEGSKGLRFNEELPVQLADQQAELADRVIDQLAETTVLQAVRVYWHTLAVDNQRIMEWRSFVDPPRSFKEIAADLGPGWTEAAARKRYSRVMEATRDHLKKHGLLEINPL